MRILGILLIVIGGHFGFLASSGLADAIGNQKDIFQATEGVMYLLLCGALLVAGSVTYRLGGAARYATESPGQPIQPGQIISPPPDSGSKAGLITRRNAKPAELTDRGYARHPGQKPHPPGTSQTYLVKLNLDHILSNRWIKRGLSGDENAVQDWLARRGIVETPDGYLMDDKMLQQFERGEVTFCHAVARNNRNIEYQRLQDARQRVIDNERGKNLHRRSSD